MKILTSLIELVTVTTLGISAGAMLTEAVILVSYWQSLPANDFLNWFKNHEELLTSFFGRLQTGGILLTLILIILLKIQKRKVNISLIVSLFFSIAIILTFFIYFKNVNASFSSATIQLLDVQAELLKWGNWQWIRTFLGISAFITALISMQGLYISNNSN